MELQNLDSAHAHHRRLSPESGSSRPHLNDIAPVLQRMAGKEVAGLGQWEEHSRPSVLLVDSPASTRSARLNFGEAQRKEALKASIALLCTLLSAALPGPSMTGTVLNVEGVETDRNEKEGIHKEFVSCDQRRHE